MKGTLFLRRGFFSFLLFIIIPNNSWAFSVTPPTKSIREGLATLVETNPFIVRGVVTGQSPYRDTDQEDPTRVIISTDVAIQVNQIYKGNLPSQEVLVKVEGGCLEEENLCYHNETSPTFEKGQQVLLFLRPTRDDKWFIWDWMYGKEIFLDGLYQPLGFSEKDFLESLKGGKQ